MAQLYKIISKTELAETSDALLKVGTVEYHNPSASLLHKLGYWPMDPELPEEPEAEDGYRIFDDGYSYKDDGTGGRIVTHTWRKLRIVDEGYPQLAENQEIISDRWEERDTEYVHVVVVYDVIDEQPAIDETTHHLKEKRWVYDAEAKTKTAQYDIVRRVDDCPPLGEGEELVMDEWAYSDEDGEIVYKRFYRIMTVVRNPPELAENQIIDNEWYEDNEETNTRTYFYRVVTVVDNPPELADGQEIVNRWSEDDEETSTRTWHYEVRTIVDEPPTLADNETVENEWWDDDGVTRTHRYEVHRRIDNAPVLAENQDVIADHWEVDSTDPYLIVHTRVYDVRTIVDAGTPELDETHFVYNDYWNDDGVNYTHVYDVWELKDDPRPEVDETNNRVIDLGSVDDPEAKTRGKKWFVKPIVRNKPDDDPDGNFKWVEDGETDTGDTIEIKYRKVIKVWRRISKLKLEAAVFELGLLEQYDAFIDGIELTNELGQKVSARRFYDQANDLSENHPMFKPYYAAALTALGLTEAQGDALLDQCVVDGTEA